MITDYINLVNKQVDHHAYLIKKLSPEKQEYQHILKDKFLKLKAFLTDLESILGDLKISSIYDLRKSIIKPIIDSPDITMADLEDLTDEEIEKLEIPKADKHEFNIIEYINSIGGTATVRKVMIGLRGITGEMPDKHYLNNKLYRMTKKDNAILFMSSMGQGHYTTINPESNTDDACSDLE